MRKQWVALLSMLGLTSAGMPLRSQVLKGSTSQGKTVHNSQVKAVNGNNATQKTGGSSKLNLNQQTLRQQNGATGGGKKADTMTPSAYCNVNKGKANAQLTPPPPGGNQQITKGSPNNQITKGNANNAVTKGSPNNQITKGGNLQVTKGNQQVTKGNQQITKGNQQLTKGNQQITKGSAVQTTAAAGPH
jgi:hypothetical protein